MKLDRKTDRALRVARRYADGGDVDQRSTLRRALNTGMDYAGRGLALADLYSGGMLSSAAGLVPGNSIANAQAARDRALEGVPREAKALATEPVTPYAAIFAGPMARTANRKMLQRAEELAAQNAPREQIWNETGWFKGPDQKWRFEIDDSEAFVKGGDITASESAKRWGPQFVGRLPDKAVMAHDKLMDAYPEISSVEFQGHSGSGGQFRSGLLEGEIVSVGDNYRGPRKTGVALHEAQHKVQDLENFGRGGNRDMFAADGAQSKAYDHAWVVANRIKSLGETPEQAAMYLANAPDGIGDAVKLKDLATRYSQEELWALAQKYKPENRYRSLAGEVEARAVESRMALTPEQRRARAPWLDYDVPEQDQIVRFR